MSKAAAKNKTTTSEGTQPLGYFGSTLLDIGWRLAAMVIGLLLLGDWLDERYKAKPVFILVALLLIIVGFVAIVRRAVNSLPAEYGGKN